MLNIAELLVPKCEDLLLFFLCYDCIYWIFRGFELLVGQKQFQYVTIGFGKLQWAFVNILFYNMMNLELLRSVYWLISRSIGIWSTTILIIVELHFSSKEVNNLIVPGSLMWKCAAFSSYIIKRHLIKYIYIVGFRTLWWMFVSIFVMLYRPND